MRKTTILLLGLFLLGQTGSSQVRIGMINAQDIMQKSSAGIKIQQALEQKQKEEEKKLKDKSDEIRRLQKDLNSPALSEEQRRSKALELENLGKEFKRYNDDAQKTISQATQENLADLEKKIMPLIAQYGKNNGFTAIYDITRSGIVYFDESIDITADIIRILDEKYPG